MPRAEEISRRLKALIPLPPNCMRVASYPMKQETIDTLQEELAKLGFTPDDYVIISDLLGGMFLGFHTEEDCMLAAKASYQWSYPFSDPPEGFLNRSENAYWIVF